MQYNSINYFFEKLTVTGLLQSMVDYFRATAVLMTKGRQLRRLGAKQSRGAMYCTPARVLRYYISFVCYLSPHYTYFITTPIRE
jgi:hypothetical protein